MILNGLPWKLTEIILSFFEIVSKYCISDSFVDYDGYSISPKGFFPTVVDIMVKKGLAAYLRLMILLLAILIPACASSSLEFCMMDGLEWVNLTQMTIISTVGRNPSEEME